MTVRRRALLVLTLGLAGCTTLERQFIPASALADPRWTRFAPAPGAAVDHAAWDAFLGRYRSVDAAGLARLDYAAVTTADRAALDAYLAALQAVDPATLERDTALAYWINLYNAATVAVVLDAYPVGSIRDVGDGAFSIGPWDRPLLRVAGAALSLNDVEHGIVRPAFDEPRIHYALNCAAVGCPDLAASAWRAEGLNARLAAAEAAYVDDPRGVSIGNDGRLTLSSLYAWFREDFADEEGGGEAAVLRRLRRVGDPALRASLEGRRGVDAYAYDWALNDAAASAVASRSR
ncbi:MAG: DUF547 domain-containing protein [Paracoccaceae bacterium]